MFVDVSAVRGDFIIDNPLTPIAPLVVGDPQFVGLRGQSYQVHGVDGEIYNLVSSATTQINAKFVFLNSGQCPVINNKKAENCWSHPGSYLGAIGIQQITEQNEKYVLLMESGSASQGFKSITLNGELLSVGSKLSSSNNEFSMFYESDYRITVNTKEFSFIFDNSDLFINQGVTSRIPLSQLTSHGLFGQTHSAKVYNSALKYIAGDVDDYVVNEGTLTGKDFVYNKFQL